MTTGRINQVTTVIFCGTTPPGGWGETAAEALPHAGGREARVFRSDWRGIRPFALQTLTDMQRLAVGGRNRGGVAPRSRRPAGWTRGDVHALCRHRVRATHSHGNGATSLATTHGSVSLSSRTHPSTHPPTHPRRGGPAGSGEWTDRRSLQRRTAPEAAGEESQLQPGSNNGNS